MHSSVIFSSVVFLVTRVTSRRISKRQKICNWECSTQNFACHRDPLPTGQWWKLNTIWIMKFCFWQPEQVGMGLHCRLTGLDCGLYVFSTNTRIDWSIYLSLYVRKSRDFSPEKWEVLSRIETKAYFKSWWVLKSNKVTWQAGPDGNDANDNSMTHIFGISAC